jgi:hypothetical protein
MDLALILLIVALILAILAAIGVSGGRISLLAASFAFYLGSLCIGVL